MADNVINVAVLNVYEDGVVVDKISGETIPAEWITWARRGSGYALNASATTDRVLRIKRTDPNLWAVLEPYYDQWKKGQAVPDGETSLASTAMFTRHQIEMLKMVHVTSIEQLAKLTDSDLRNLGMGGSELRTKARHFVNNKNDSSKVATLLADRDAKIEALMARMVELEAAAKPVEVDTEYTPRRGRPPRVLSEGAE